MKRLAILTAGGDTPALNATLHGAVVRANQLEIEVLGILDGFGGLLDTDLPHVPLNPLFAVIPELDPCRGGMERPRPSGAVPYGGGRRRPKHLPK